MSAQLLISGVIFGLSLASIYFLISVGLSLCFGLMRIISLDQLLYYSVGAFLAYTVSTLTGNFWLGLIAGVAVGVMLALAVERLIFRRIYERELTFSMITSFGILLGGIGAIKGIWGVVPKPVPVPFDNQISLFGTDIPVYRLLVVVLAGLVYGGIWLFLNRTIIGKAIRAGIEDMEHVKDWGSTRLGSSQLPSCLLVPCRLWRVVFTRRLSWLIPTWGLRYWPSFLWWSSSADLGVSREPCTPRYSLGRWCRSVR